MSRKKPEVRKQELIQIAYEQFLKNGYEKTSIRSIVGEAKGEIGMFYHHFSSKDAIFNAVLDEYNKKYLTRIKEVVYKSEELSFWEVIDLIINDLETSSIKYKEINNGFADKSVLKRFHQSTLELIEPCFCDLINKYVNRGEISPPKVDVETMTKFSIYGISAIIHMDDDKCFSQKHQEIILLLKRLF